MTETTAEDTKIVALRLATELDAPIGTVWRALTEPAIVARWLLAGGIGAEPGRRFSLDGDAGIGGRIDCEVVESVPPRVLAYLWRLPADERGVVLETLVRFTLAPLPGDRTQLDLVHDGFEVPISRPVDRVEEEGIVVLLPLDAIARRRIPRRRSVLLRPGMLPAVMWLAA